MSRRKTSREDAEAATADLEAMSRTVGQVLPRLLVTGDAVALVRWSQVRSWIDNALDGEPSPDLATIGLAVAYLADLTGQRGGTGRK